ncbi:MAG: hypothetical protein EA401_08570, partial [Planctomycetota bacterium]
MPLLRLVGNQSLRRRLLSPLCCLLLLPGLWAEDALDELRGIRDQLRKHVEEMYAADAAKGVVLDVDLHFDHGIGPRQRGMVLHLQRLGERWAPARVSGSDALRRDHLHIDCSALEIDDDTLSGEIVFSWQEQAAIPDDDDETSVEALTGVRTMRQRVAIAVDVISIQRRLRLTLQRFASGQDWVLHFAPEDDGWRFIEEASAPRALSAEGGFDRHISLSRDNSDAAWHLDIQLTNRVQEGRERIFHGYEERGHPRVHSNFYMIEEHIHGVWLRRAAGGKNFLGNASGTISG